MVVKASKGGRKASKLPNGVILYRGPSMLDGSPIVVVATGLRVNSKNEKTGALVPTYILADNGRDPLEDARQDGARSICGDCPHAPRPISEGEARAMANRDGKSTLARYKFGSCYVNVAQGPTAVYVALQRGSYPEYNEASHAALFAGRILRLGAYGDPGAVPLAVWDGITRHVVSWRGYTHQWRTISAGYAKYCMASVETLTQRRAARRLGYRTFRVRLAGQRIGAGEIVCPASAEAGKRRTCADCNACSGAKAGGRNASPVIIFHGSEAGGNWKRRAYESTMAEIKASEAGARRLSLPMM